MRTTIRLGSAYTPPPRMTGTRRMEVGGPIEPLHRTYKYLRPRNALVILALAVLAWVPVALVLV